LGDRFLVNDELRWAVVDIFADNEFKKPGIKDSMRGLLAFP